MQGLQSLQATPTHTAQLFPQRVPSQRRGAREEENKRPTSKETPPGHTERANKLYVHHELRCDEAVENDPSVPSRSAVPPSNAGNIFEAYRVFDVQRTPAFPHAFSPTFLPSGREKNLSFKRDGTPFCGDCHSLLVFPWLHSFSKPARSQELKSALTLGLSRLRSMYTSEFALFLSLRCSLSRRRAYREAASSLRRSYLSFHVRTAEHEYFMKTHEISTVSSPHGPSPSRFFSFRS